VYPATFKVLFPALLLSLFSLGAYAATMPAKPANAPSNPPSNVVAEIEGEKITTEELEKSIGTELGNLQEQIYNLKRQRLDQIIEERLLAKEAGRQKISTTALIDKEVVAKVGLVTEQDIETFYQANKERIKDSPQVRPQIREYLQQQRLTAERKKYIAFLREKAKVAVSLPTPPRVRVEIAAASAPLVKGSAKAPITIVKFEDFQCSYCKQSQPTLAQLEARYGDKIKVVHRDFPLDSIHPLARRAAEGARCADQQGRFWSYHDRLYATNLTADPGQLSALAKDEGLDVAKFDTCLSSGQYKAAVQSDLEDGQKAGVTATPAFFVNGRLLLGAQPLENFVQAVDEELEMSNIAVQKR